MSDTLRTIAIIAHVDHGKTTLVDAMLKQGGAFAAHEETGELIMDSNDQERERGITIYAKNASIRYKGQKINIVDTPGHADFGSEVERVLRMCDSVLLVVDAQEGPMPQTKFVLKKSLEIGLKPIVVVNKIDKPAQRATEVVNEVFDLFAALGANDDQLDFPVCYAIAREGMAKMNLTDESSDLTPLFDLIMQKVPESPKRMEAPLQLQPASLAYDKYVGRMAIGRITGGVIKVNQSVSILRPDASPRSGRISKIYVFDGVKRTEVQEASSGEIVQVAGLPDISVGETIAASADTEVLPMIKIDPPTVTMEFQVNNSPFAGKEGTLLTTRHIRERLDRELETNVGLQVEDIPGTDSYKVSGRGELHLSVLIEGMRREGFELQLSRPEVIMKEENGKTMEPLEQVIVDVPEEFSGTVISLLSQRKGEMVDMRTNQGHTRMEFTVPTRGLLGFRGEFIIETRGEGILTHAFIGYIEHKGEMPGRRRGSIISMIGGEAVAFALWNLQERGVLFILPQTQVYEGMIIGESAKPDDMTVNPIKGKKLTNMRASGSDENIMLIPARVLSLEQALEYIQDDELVEVTPKNIRLRKKLLTENERKKA